MTSLELQLKRLKVPATQSLDITRDNSSLLFESKVAAGYGREEFYEIGLNGLAQLKKFDDQFDLYEPELFSKAAMDLNRTMLGKEEHDELNESLERMITRLAPYFHQQACKQVLEWLIYKYHIHSFNAEFLFTALLPYHTSNSFGRLLSILKFNKPEWNFAEDFAKSGSPIPMNILMRVCFANNSFFLVPVLANFLLNAIKTVGEEYVEKRLHPSFTFFANFMMHLFEEQSRVDNQMIARVMPFIGTALKSKVLPFKYAGLVIVSKIVSVTSLTPEVLNNIMKLILLKMKEKWLDSALDTVALICQTQNVSALPKKPILKLIRKREELNLTARLLKMSETYDISAFFAAFWETLLACLQTESDKELQTEIADLMVETLSLERMDKQQSAGFLNSVMEFLNNPEATERLPKSLRQHIRVLVIRFSSEFDTIRAEWMVRDEKVVDKLMKECRIEPHEVGEMVVEFANKKKRRRRTSSSNNSGSKNDVSREEEDLTLISVIRPNPEDQITSEQKMRKAQEEVAEQRSPFRKSVLKILEMMKAVKESSQQLESPPSSVSDLEWALESLSLPQYLKKQSNDDLEEFFVQTVLYMSSVEGFLLKGKVKVALAQIKLDPDALLLLLSDLTDNSSDQQQRSLRRRKSGVVVKSRKERLAEVFSEEDSIGRERRLVFVLEVFAISSVNFHSATADMVRRLFDLMERAQPTAGKWLSETDPVYLQQLCLSSVGNILDGQGTVRRLFADNFPLDPLVKTIRFTQAPVVLRKALKVLALVAPTIPSQAISQFMSLFTFMGDGTLKRDNELTLSVFEETLHALFGALLVAGKGMRGLDDELSNLNFQRKILEISKMLSHSLMDIPAHRRIRILRAVAQQIPSDSLWIVMGVLFEDFCIRWEKARSKRQEKIENLDDISLELVGELEPEHQLHVIISLLDYIVRLGGDAAPTNGRAKSHPIVIFDRASHEIRKLRHFRFVILGFVNKCLNNKALGDKLANLSYEAIYERTLRVGKRLLSVVMQLTDFVDEELLAAEKLDKAERGTASEGSSSQALKYWIALSGKTDAASNKLRCILPANVSGQIICNLLEEKGLEKKTRDRALQLLNVKLMHEPVGSGKSKKGEQKLDPQWQYLGQLTLKLNEWLVPAENKDEVALCQKASFTLKLLAKKVLQDTTAPISTTFNTTFENCLKVLSQWSSMDGQLVGNVLLLVAELVHSQNLRSILAHTDSICIVCMEILEHCVQEAKESQEEEDAGEKSVDTETEEEEEIEVASESSTAIVKESPTRPPVVMRKRQRSFRLSTSGRPFGDNGLLTCALACTQQLLDHFGDKFAETNECEEAAIEAFLGMITNLSESHLSPIIDSLSEWVERALNGEDRLRLLTVYNFANRFYETFNTLALPHFDKLLSLAPRLLIVLNPTRTAEEDLLLDGRDKTSLGALQVDRLILHLISFVSKCAKHSFYFNE